MKINYFELKINTTNPSADMCGNFETEIDAKNTLDKKLEVIKNDPEYYGSIENITWSIEPKTLFLGEEYFD